MHCPLCICASSSLKEENKNHLLKIFPPPTLKNDSLFIRRFFARLRTQECSMHFAAAQNAPNVKKPNLIRLTLPKVSLPAGPGGQMSERGSEAEAQAEGERGLHHQHSPPQRAVHYKSFLLQPYIVSVL